PIHRVVLSGRLAAPPRLACACRAAVALLRVMVGGDHPPDRSEEPVAEVDCFAFYDTAAYLAAHGKAGSGIWLDGRLYLDAFLSADGQIARRLCVHIDHAELIELRPRAPAAPTSANGTAATPPPDWPDPFGPLERKEGE